MIVINILIVSKIKNFSNVKSNIFGQLIFTRDLREIILPSLFDFLTSKNRLRIALVFTKQRLFRQQAGELQHIKRGTCQNFTQFTGIHP